MDAPARLAWVAAWRCYRRLPASGGRVDPAGVGVGGLRGGHAGARRGAGVPALPRLGLQRHPARVERHLPRPRHPPRQTSAGRGCSSAAGWRCGSPARRGGRSGSRSCPSRPTPPRPTLWLASYAASATAMVSLVHLPRPPRPAAHGVGRRRHRGGRRRGARGAVGGRPRARGGVAQSMGHRSERRLPAVRPGAPLASGRRAGHHRLAPRAGVDGARRRAARPGGGRRGGAVRGAPRHVRRGHRSRPPVDELGRADLLRRLARAPPARVGPRARSHPRRARELHVRGARPARLGQRRRAQPAVRRPGRAGRRAVRRSPRP